MKRILPLFKALTKNWVRSKSGVFFSFLFPLLLLVIFSTVFGGEEVKFHLYVQNLDNDSQLSIAFIEALNSTRAFEIEVVNKTNLADLIKPFSHPRLLVIPPGFHASAINSTVKSRISVIVSTLQIAKRYAKENRSEIERGMKALEEFNRSLPEEKAWLILYVDRTTQKLQFVQLWIALRARLTSNFSTQAKLST